MNSALSKKTIVIIVFFAYLVVLSVSGLIAALLLPTASIFGVFLFLLFTVTLTFLLHYLFIRFYFNQITRQLSESLTGVSEKGERHLFFPNSALKVAPAIKFHFETLLNENEQLYLEIQELKGIYSSILDTQDELVFIIDKDGYISFRNRAFDQAFGSPSLGFNKENSIFSENLTILMQEISPLIIEQSNFGNQKQLRTQFVVNGEVRYISWVLKQDLSQEMVRNLFVGRDETEELKVRKKHEKIEKIATVGRAASTIFHEINQPLSIIHLSTFLIKNALEQLNDELEIKEELIKNSNIIESQINRSNQIIKNLRLFHSGEKKRLLFEPLLVNELINESLATIKNELEANDIELITIYGHADDAVITGNKTLFIQMLINIFQNALHALKMINENQSRKIILSTQTTEKTISISIEDNGLGIPEEELAQVTEPFFTTKEEGSGLGLALCLDIINNYQGSLEIKNVLPNGLRTTINFPLDSTASQEVP